MWLLVLLGVGLTVGSVVALSDDDSDSDNASSNPGEENLEGTPGRDQLVGTEGNDTIFARESIDLVEGRGGDDRLFGQEGNDAMSGGTGDDFIRGGAGNDVLLDHEGNDTFYGDSGNDMIISTSAIDGEEFASVARDAVAQGRVSVPEIRALFSFDDDTDEQADEIHAGKGDDLVAVGEGDVATLGDGNDSIAVGDWMEPGDEEVRITDFNVDEDQLIYSHDGRGQAPQLSVQHVGGEDGDALLFANDELVVRIEKVGPQFSLSDVKVEERTSRGVIVG